MLLHKGEVGLEIFRAYDVRGIYGEELSPEISYEIGLAFGQFMGEKKRLSVARDVRLSSPVLEYTFEAGMLASGCDVIALGVQPTPLLYFSIAHLGLDGGAVITASHNPPEYNGIKLCREKSFSLTYESGIKEIRKQVLGKTLRSQNWNSLGKEETLEIRPAYEAYLKERIELGRKINMVIDAGNGTCGFVGDMLERMGCQVEMLFPDPDGRFPNHIPNPLMEETLETLKKRVVELDADLGIAFDGDGDRVGFVDEKGVVVKGDQTMMIFAEDVIKETKKPKILFDVATSRAVPEYIQMLGGKPLMTRVGHSYVMEALHNENGKMAAEISGHYYFADDYYGFDDGIYAAARMTEIVSRSSSKLSEMVRRLPSYISTPEERIECSDERKFKVVERVKELLESAGYKIVTIDGVRIELEDAWALVRASNTEPAIVLRFEGNTVDELKKVEGTVKEVIEKVMKKG
jgi:phosphomannomutase/phosphoglucomutase